MSIFFNYLSVYYLLLFNWEVILRPIVLIHYPVNLYASQTAIAREPLTWVWIIYTVYVYLHSCDILASFLHHLSIVFKSFVEPFSAIFSYRQSIISTIYDPIKGEILMFSKREREREKEGERYSLWWLSRETNQGVCISSGAFIFSSLRNTDTEPSSELFAVLIDDKMHRKKGSSTLDDQPDWQTYAGA